MKEDLNIHGNEYTYMLSKCVAIFLRGLFLTRKVRYTIAFAIMQIPSNMIALKVRPCVCITLCELGWTALSSASAFAQVLSRI